ncbi:hypothetical protein BV898_01328 [Hypsibius exemplaris]|uniref:Uncharacterized protein n=1 Tax=Hypsibius exemplaris TaxID=2072580 RepID=A0A1W0XB44_HYPEX|nr:hypothetical protein BV898_01328 [Hypsibius exemplaris]
MMVLHPFRAALWIIPLWAYRTVIGDHACLPEQQQLGEISAVLGFNRIGGTVLVPVGDDMFVCEVRAAGNDRSGIFCRHHDSKIVSYDQAEWQQIIALDSVITGLWVSNVQQTCYVAAVTKANLLIFSARKDPAISLLALDPVATSSNAYARAYPSLVIAPPPPQQSYRGPSIQLDHTDLTDNEEMPTQTPPPTPPPATSTTIGVTRLLKLDSIPVTEEQSAVTYVPGAKKIQILQPQEQTPYRGPPLYMDEEDVVDNDEVPTQTIPPVPVVISTTSQPVTIDRYLQLELLDLGEQRTTIVPGAKKIEIQQPRQQERYQSPSIYLGPADLEDNAEVPVQTPRLVSVVMSKPYGVDRYLQLDLLDVGEKGTTPGAKEIEIRPMSHYSSPALPLQQVILVPPQYNPPPILLPGIRYSNTSYNPSEYDEVAPPVAATPAAVMMVENYQLAPHPAAVPAYYPPQNSSLDGQSQVPLLPLILAQPEPYPTDNSNAAQYLSSGTPQVLFQAPNVHEVASPVAPYAPYFVQPSRLIPELDEDYAEFLMTRTTSPVPVESATYIDVPVAPVARLPDQELSHQTAPQVVAIANPIKSDASQIEEESEEELTPEVVATRGTVPAQDTMTPVETAYVVEQATVRPPGIHLTDEPIDRERDGDLAEDYADGREPAFVTSPTPEVYTGSEPPVVTETVDRVSYGDFDYEEVERPTTQQGSYPVQPPWTANETMRVNVPVSYIMPIPPQIDQFGFGVHHDDFDPTNMDFSEVPVAESGFSSYPPTAKSTSPSPVPAPPAIEQIGTTVLPVVRGVTGDADYEEIPMASWQHSQQVALPMSSPTWVFYNGSLPSAINALPDESQMIWSSIPPNGLNIPSQMADPSVPGIRASPEEAIEDDEADIESSFRPSQGSPISPNTNYSVGDRTMTLESVYGRPMVIVKTQPGENVTGPRVQVYLDETADVGQYLLNPVQFPAVLVQQIEHVEGSQSSLPFPLLGPDQQQQSESPADLPPGSQSIGLNILDVPDEDYTEIQPGPPLPTVQPGTGPKNGTVQPAPGQFVSLSPSVEVSEALPSQPRVHYLDVNLNRDSIDLEDYSEVDIGKTSPPPTVPVAEFVPSSSSPIAPVPAIRYTNESGFDFHTEALDFAEYVNARQPLVELPLVPPESVLPESVRPNSPLPTVQPGTEPKNGTVQPAPGQFVSLSPSVEVNEALRSQPRVHYLDVTLNRDSIDLEDYSEVDVGKTSPPPTVPVAESVPSPTNPIASGPAIRYTNDSGFDFHTEALDFAEYVYARQPLVELPLVSSESVLPESVQPNFPLPTVQPGTEPKNGTVQPAPRQSVYLSPSVEVNEALPSQPRVHYLDVNLNRDSIDVEDYSEVDVGKTSVPPTVPVAESVPLPTNPMAPVPAIRYTNESGFDFHTEALDFAEYIYARQPFVELPLVPPESVLPESVLPESVRLNFPLPTVQPGTEPKNGTVQPAPSQSVYLSPSVEVNEALPSQPRVHYLDVNLNRDSIDLEDYSEVDIGKTSPPPTVPVAEFVPSSSSPIAPVPAIRYTNESGFDFHTEALDFAEYLHARQPSVELPLAPPKSVAQVEPASASMNLPLAPLGGSPSAPFPGIHYTNDSISRTHGHDADYDEALPVRPVSTPPSSPPVIQTVLPPAQPVVAPPSPPLPRLRHTNITAGDRDHYLSEDYSEMQYPPPVANNLASVTQQEPSPTTPAPPHEIAQGINNYDDRIPIAATTYPFIPVTYPPPTPVVYVQSQPGARRIEIRPAAVEMSVAPSRGYRWRKPPTTPSKADEGLHGPLSPPVTAPVPEWVNRFGQRVPAPIQPKQEPAQSLPTPPALSSPQQKPPTRRNRFGQKIKVSLPEAAPSLPSFGLAPPQLPSDPSQQNTLMGYQLKFTGDLGQPRRNRFGQTVRPSSPNDLHLLRRDAGTKQGWIPMTAPEPPSSVPQLDRRQPTVNSPPAGITYGQMPYPIAQTDKTPPSPRNEKWNQNEYYSGQPEPPAAQTVPPSLTDPVTEAPTGSLISSLLVNKTWSETASPIVHNICQPGVVLEDRTITEFVDCEESDISELVITITPKNGSGSFHYEIVPEGDTPDAGKFSIDESNGEIYASATFSSKVDSWDADSLGPDLVYEVKVRVSDELCDQSDEAFMSIAFRCKDRSSPTEALAVKRPISRR